VLLTPRWVAVHAGVLILVAAFLALGRWQAGRAADGNLLSYGYAFQWPAFAVFVVWVWVVEMRKALRTGPPVETSLDPGETGVVDVQPTRTRPRPTRSSAAYDDSDDPQLAAYNHYLAWLNAHPHASPADYPGPSASKELSS
jgi:DNA-binding transcriptional regulator of glucitol operon